MPMAPGVRAALARRLLRLALLASATDQHRGPPPEVGDAIAVETEYGVLYLPRHDDVITPHVWEHRSWEPGETAFLQATLRPGMTVLDIGAHVGWFTLLAARLVGHRGLVFAFEPHPRNFDLLLANVWRNSLANVVCFPWAVGDHAGFGELHAGDTNTGDNRLYASDEERETIPVRIAALDSIGALRPPLDVVKIDVQGAEGAVVRGMRNLLAASPDVVVVAEFWPHGIGQSGGDARAVLEEYRSLGFRIRLLDDAGAVDCSDDALLERCAGTLHVDLVLTRR
jgi:FkbM family methyltransferase